MQAEFIGLNIKLIFGTSTKRRPNNGFNMLWP